MLASKAALILVDLQNDFCAQGSLAVPEGDAVIAIANVLQPRFHKVIATQDWHPANHQSFASQHPGQKPGAIIMLHGIRQVLWPDHCVQHTHGAELHPKLTTQHIDKIFYKGTDPRLDSYSAFFDNGHLHATGLAEYLQQESITDVYLLGLATDYCVKFSCLDAVKLNFNVYLIADACRGVELQPGDTARALQELQTAGVHILNSNLI